MIYRLGELFCGPGGLAKASSMANFVKDDEVYAVKHIWASDYDEDSCKTYRYNICPEHPESVICEDVHTLDINSLGEIDAFMYGFPCNDFSIVGESMGFNGTFGPLYTYGVKVINRFKPKWFLAENVGGLSSANKGKAFTKIIQDLANAGEGYTLTIHLYKFEDYGIPQSRHRIIIVGIDNTLEKIFHVPKPSANIKTCKEAIENPPIPKEATNQELTRMSPRVVERLKHIKPGQNVWNAKLPDHLKLNVKGAKLSQIYRRLDPNQPAYTVTGSGGGGTHGYHWAENRALTNRERARLQTFPDDYVFFGSKEKVRKQIGMAVPVEGANIIITSIFKTLAGVTYDYIQPSFGYVRPDDLHNKMTFLKGLTDTQYFLPFTASNR